MDILSATAQVALDLSQKDTTTTGIQSGPEAFVESRFIKNVLTILTVIKILCRITKKYTLVSGVPGNEKKIQIGGPKKKIFF